MLDINIISHILEYTKEEAIRTGWYFMTPDHLVLGIIRHRNNLACDFMTDKGLHPEQLKNWISEDISLGIEIKEEEWKGIDATPELKKVLELSSQIMKKNRNYDDTLVFLMAILQTSSSSFRSIASEYDITPETIMERMQGGQNRNDGGMENDKDYFSESGIRTDEALLYEYGKDLVEAAATGLIDPVVCRDREINRIIEVLSRRKKNNPLIVGDPGSGKTAIIEGLAARIAKGDVPFTLLGKSIISLDIVSIVAGTKFRGDFEGKMQSILNTIKEHPEVIVFIDELHNLVGAGGQSGAIDAAEMLKQALSRGDFQCIGTTTPDEYRRVIEKDGTLERRFQKIAIDPPTHVQTAEIIRHIAPKYEEFHNVKYTEDALAACISLSTKYITNRSLPDKAIDLLDEAGARATVGRCHVPDEFFKLVDKLHAVREKKRVAIENNDSKAASATRKREIGLEDKIQKLIQDTRFPKEKQVITATDVQNVTAAITGIPVSKIAQSESKRLLNMSNDLKQKIIGQDQAVENVVKAIIRNRAGLKDPGKPIGTFLFLGPTGVGKTHLAKLLAEYLFDTPDAIIRLDMSEYMDKFTVSRLIGAPPGYLGYNDGGQLSNRVRQKPYSVVLLDEIEKAHPDIFNLLLQIFDEGRLTDSSGTHVDFRNTVLIMTSNVGSRDLNDFGNGIGYSFGVGGDRQGYNRSIIDKALGKVFSPEFINRLDDIVYFNNLAKEDISRIVDIEMSGLYHRAAEAGFPITLTARAKNFICEKGFDPKFGARPLKRAISHYIEDLVAETIISGKSGEGEEILLDLNTSGDALTAGKSTASTEMSMS